MHVAAACSFFSSLFVCGGVRKNKMVSPELLGDMQQPSTISKRRRTPLPPAPSCRLEMEDTHDLIEHLLTLRTAVAGGLGLHCRRLRLLARSLCCSFAVGFDARSSEGKELQTGRTIALFAERLCPQILVVVFCILQRQGQGVGCEHQTRYGNTTHARTHAKLCIAGRTGVPAHVLLPMPLWKLPPNLALVSRAICTVSLA